NAAHSHACRIAVQYSPVHLRPPLSSEFPPMLASSTHTVSLRRCLCALLSAPRRSTVSQVGASCVSCGMVKRHSLAPGTRVTANGDVVPKSGTVIPESRTYIPPGCPFWPSLDLQRADANFRPARIGFQGGVAATRRLRVGSRSCGSFETLNAVQQVKGVLP